MTTVAPEATELPPEGFWLTTRPAFEALHPDVAVAAETVSPWPCSVLVAPPWLRPITF